MGAFGSRFETHVEGCFAVANAGGVSACVCACGAAARRGEAQAQGQARRAAAARELSFCPGEAWRARRVVMTPHAEKFLVTHRGGSEPEQATCRMTGGPRKRFFQPTKNRNFPQWPLACFFFAPALRVFIVDRRATTPSHSKGLHTVLTTSLSVNRLVFRISPKRVA